MSGAATAMLSVYDGQQCCGFILSRGSKGFEAFDADQTSVGVFATQREAAGAIMRAQP